MKKQWTKPFVGVQEFVPQEFIAACAADEYYRVYKFWCNFNAGRYVWIETNGTPGLQSSGNWFNNWETDLRYDRTWASRRDAWGTFSPCGSYHEVSIPCDASGNPKEDINEIFPAGYVNTRTSARGAQSCYVWTDGGTNTHVTQHLDVSDYEIKNPS